MFKKWAQEGTLASIPSISYFILCILSYGGRVWTTTMILRGKKSSKN